MGQRRLGAMARGGGCCGRLRQALDCSGPANNAGCFVSVTEGRLCFFSVDQEDEGDVMSVCAEGSCQGTATRGRTRACIGCMMGWTGQKSPVLVSQIFT